VYQLTTRAVKKQLFALAFYDLVFYFFTFLFCLSIPSYPLR